MKSWKPLLITLLITLCSPFQITRALASDGNSQITPVVTVAPNLFAVGEFSTTFVCLSNGNPNSTKSIQSGDTFKLTFDPSIGALAAVVAPVLVNSSNLNAADFTAVLGSAPNQIIITYNGATKVFTPGDSVCLKVTFMANSVIGSGKVTCDSPTANGDPGRYNSIEPKYTTISIVDFATGPPGPPGPGSVTSVSGTSPIVVTNPTTAPNISLGIVPTGNGGTGLGAAGASGNFLRSNGGAWTSAPLSPADIPAGNGNYIQNGIAQQAAASFNISGNGTAGGTLTGSIVNAATQYNINGLRAFTVNGPFNDGFNNYAASNTFTGNSAGVSTTPDPSPSIFGKANSFYGAGAGQTNTTGSVNAFFGFETGLSNTTGFSNAFFGGSAGASNTSGHSNVFLGNAAGFNNTTGYSNVFVGSFAGYSHTTACCNAFVGDAAGFNNTTGSGNAFFGVNTAYANTTGESNAFFGGGAGFFNTTGSHNAFFGSGAGENNASGSQNIFIGEETGRLNTSGNLNTFIGFNADFNGTNTTGSNNTLIGPFIKIFPNLTNATAVGANAFVGQSNSLVLGSIINVNGATASTNVGIGTTAPKATLDVRGGNILVGSAGQGIILKAPNGTTCRLLTIDNTGAMVLSAVGCP